MCRGASLVAQTVKNLPAMQDTWVRSLGSKDPLKEGMATHSSLLAWETPGTDKPGGLQMVGVPVSFKMLVFSGCIPRHRIAGSEGTSVFCFLRLHTVLPSGSPLDISNHSAGTFSSLHTVSSIYF